MFNKDNIGENRDAFASGEDFLDMVRERNN